MRQTILLPRKSVNSTVAPTPRINALHVLRVGPDAHAGLVSVARLPGMEMILRHLRPVHALAPLTVKIRWSPCVECARAGAPAGAARAAGPSPNAQLETAQPHQRRNCRDA
jgi:hypothetical protein